MMVLKIGLMTVEVKADVLKTYSVSIIRVDVYIDPDDLDGTMFLKW
jgi:hypothetical protein